MASDRKPALIRPARLALALGVVLAAFGASAADEVKLPPLPPALEKAAPEGVEDLKAIQEQVRKVVEKVTRSTVGVRIGASQGSGVIIKEGYVLTAGHVSGAAGRDVTLVLHDGKTVKGKTLGANRGIDSGLIKITTEGDWPAVEMGSSADLKKGQWCVAVGHPGGFKPGRTPVVRLGRILSVGERGVVTDCTLVGGDSGGPLFDMHGRVIGIHSRIGGSIASNTHVPVDTYRDTWERLAKSEVWGGGIAGKPRPNEPYLGVELDTEAKDCRVAKVVEGTAAEKAGLKAGDVILKFAGQAVASGDDLRPQIMKRQAGDKVELLVRRGDDTLNLELTLGKRP